MALNAAVHKNILLQVLTDIYSDNTLGPFLGFKGGTAAYLFYELERFSVDLDFNLLDETQEDHVFEKIEKILRKHGEVREAERKRFNLLFILSYDKKEKNAQNVKLEVSRRGFHSKYELRSYMGISMLVMTQEDMFAHKLMAMYERMERANRDVYDVWFFSKNNWPINKEIVEKRTDLPFKNFLEKCITRLEGLNNNTILSGLGELLNAKQKAWVKTKLKTETLFFLRLALENEKSQ